MNDLKDTVYLEDENSVKYTEYNVIADELKAFIADNKEKIYSEARANTERVGYKPLDMEVIRKKPSKIISMEEALKDVEPFDWGEK